MSDTMLQSTLREMHDLIVRPRLWLVFAVVVGLFVVTGPFGTYDTLAFPTRLGYWLVLHAATWGCALLSVSAFDALLADRVRQRLVRMLIGAVGSCLPVGGAITLINFALRDRPLAGAMLLDNIAVSLPISLGFSLLVWLSLSSGTGPDAPAATPEQTGAGVEATAAPGMAPLLDPGPLSRPALLDRLPHDKRGALIRLEVQDHYVLVVTTRGSDLVLMRLGDAIAETGETGQQIHRSHWVADAGVIGLVREGGSTPRLTVSTSDGCTLPVSRTHAASVRARWGDLRGGA